MDAITALLTRRSIRRFTADPVNSEHVDMLLHCAMAGPTGYNQQSWRFVVVREAPTRAALATASNWGAMAAEAPVVIVVCGDTASERHRSVLGTGRSRGAREHPRRGARPRPGGGLDRAASTARAVPPR